MRILCRKKLTKETEEKIRGTISVGNVHLSNPTYFKRGALAKLIDTGRTITFVLHVDDIPASEMNAVNNHKLSYYVVAPGGEIVLSTPETRRQATFN